MPLPTPRTGEERPDFIARCIPVVLESEDLDSDSEADRDQAAAICYSQWRNAATNAADTLRFACNVATQVREAQWEGRTWLVAPVVALRSGVLNDELVPPEEVLAHPQAWNGRPVVVYHPQSEEGRPVSANSPEVLSRQQIGTLFNVRAERNGVAKLHGELWIDLARAAQVGGPATEVVRRLRAGEPLEVSTAYYRDVTPTMGVLEDREYHTIARHIRPDHLAALPDQVGACSWEDGCGAPRVNRVTPSADAEDPETETETTEVETPQNEQDGGREAMNQRIERIMEDGRLALNAEQLSELGEAELDGILMALEAMPDRETPAEDTERVEDPEDSETPGTNAAATETTEAETEAETPDPAINAEVEELLTAVREMGGVAVLRAAVADFATSAQARRETLIGQLVANEACMFTREQLERMDEENLRTLRGQLEPVDYLGQARVLAQDGEVELAMPSLEFGEQKS